MKISWYGCNIYITNIILPNPLIEIQNIKVSTPQRQKPKKVLEEDWKTTVLNSQIHARVSDWHCRVSVLPRARTLSSDPRTFKRVRLEKTHRSTPSLSSPRGASVFIDDPAITCPAHLRGSPHINIYNLSKPRIEYPSSASIYLRMAQAVLQLSLGKLTGLGGGGAGGV
jgi:hypothetical protein